MIGPFEGPVTKTAPHARLFYQRHFNPEKVWSSWAGILKNIDDFIENHPRLELATDELYLYFFGPDAKECWVGREIVGHLSRWPEGFNAFDSFKGEVFEWRLGKVPFENSGEFLLDAEQQLRSLAPEALASTWRVALSPMEFLESRGEADRQAPQVAFQFYKKS